MADTQTVCTAKCATHLQAYCSSVIPSIRKPLAWTNETSNVKPDRQPNTSTVATSNCRAHFKGYEFSIVLSIYWRNHFISYIRAYQISNTQTVAISNRCANCCINGYAITFSISKSNFVSSDDETY